MTAAVVLVETAIVVVIAAVSPIIVAALIGGVFMVVNQVATLMIERHFDRREYERSHSATSEGEDVGSTDNRHSRNPRIHRMRNSAGGRTSGNPESETEASD